MFTGIVTDLGTVREVQPLGDGNDMRLVIGTSPAFLSQPAPAVIGASIACSGCARKAGEVPMTRRMSLPSPSGCTSRTVPRSVTIPVNMVTGSPRA